VRVAVVVDPERPVSWDHRKLAALDRRALGH